jgi:murein DD-endopeptidase MepM/ murein hydrolase activator NlpD
MVAQETVRALPFAIGTALLFAAWPAGAHPPEGATPPAPAFTAAAPGQDAPDVLAPPARTDRATNAEIAARASRLGLGERAAANVLLVGPPRPDWIEAAGGGNRAADLLWPLQGGRFMRGYGSGRRGRHRAMDIGAAAGAPIRAAERGIVAYADRDVRGYGRLVMLVHPGGWVTYYAHASELLVRPGQLVQRGEVIARVGHSGIARGDHLHFELREQGVKLDPSGLLVDLPAGLHLEARQTRVPDGRSPLGWQTHPPTRSWRVRRGDTLLRLARRHGASVRELQALNGLRRTARLRLGQELVVPSRPPATPPRNHRRR